MRRLRQTRLPTRAPHHLSEALASRARASFTCLHQKDAKGERTPAEAQLFGRALTNSARRGLTHASHAVARTAHPSRLVCMRAVMDWYAHYKLLTFKLTALPGRRPAASLSDLI